MILSGGTTLYEDELTTLNSEVVNFAPLVLKTEFMPELILSLQSGDVIPVFPACPPSLPLLSPSRTKRS